MCASSGGPEGYAALEQPRNRGTSARGVGGRAGRARGHRARRGRRGARPPARPPGAAAAAIPHSPNILRCMLVGGLKEPHASSTTRWEPVIVCGPRPRLETQETTATTESLSTSARRGDATPLLLTFCPCDSLPPHLVQMTALGGAALSHGAGGLFSPAKIPPFIYEGTHLRLAEVGAEFKYMGARAGFTATRRSARDVIAWK